MKKKLLTALQYSIFLGLGIFLVWWSIHKMDDTNWEHCKQALKSANYILFIPVFFIISASHISRAMRWKILMKPMGYNPGFLNTFFAVMIGYLTNLAIPRLGEVIKCTIIGKYEKVPPDKLVGTILVERVVDVLCLGIVFLIALITQLDLLGHYAKKTIRENFLKGGTNALLIKLAITVTLIVVFYIGLKFIFRKYSHNAFIIKIKKIFAGVRAGITSIRYLQNKWEFIFHSIFIWCCYLSGTYLGFYATIGTENLPVAATFPILAFASIGMIITPGGIGAYPRFIMQVMLLYNVEEGIAFANGNLQWIAQTVIILLVGFISVLLLPYINKRKVAEEN